MLSTIDVLLVTATDTETKATHRAAERVIGSPHEIEHGATCAFFMLGEIAGAKVALIQGEMGSATPGGSSISIADAICESAARTVIMVGIAFGVDRIRQSIGQVLVSTQVQYYELQRIGTADSGLPVLRARGVRAPASTVRRRRSLGKRRPCYPRC